MRGAGAGQCFDVRLRHRGNGQDPDGDPGIQGERVMSPTQIHRALVHAVTEYDQRESSKRSYNRYALSQYLNAIERVDLDLACDRPIRNALIEVFNGRLLDRCLKA